LIVVFAMAGVIWGIGAAMKAPKQARWIMIGLLLAGVIAINLILPDGHPLREGLGGDARLWLLILAFVGIALAYRSVLRRLRSRVVDQSPPPPVAGTGTPSDAELRRYARHIALREVGGPGQMALRRARVLVVGAGGLGSPVIQYLAAAGVGTLGIIDDDTVDATNLHRQVIFRSEDVDEPKATTAAQAASALNPYITVKPYNRRLTAEIAPDLVADYDLVLDGTDNFATRYLVNATCVAAGIPLIAAAITQWEGQISLYDPARGGPCFQCIFPETPDPALVPTCAEAGVIGPLPGVIGAMMAVEAIKHITQAGEGLRGRLMIHDALYADTRLIMADRRVDCPVCKG
jgi:molybdopterin/thiamine biosynthesis adenylyltransferase